MMTALFDMRTRRGGETKYEARSEERGMMRRGITDILKSKKEVIFIWHIYTVYI